jgi:hypothetical protein
MAIAVSVWVCMASAVTTAAVRSKQASRSRTAGLVAFRGDGDLSEHGAVGVVERGDQVRGGRRRGAGAAHGLAVQGDHLPTVHHVAAGPQPRPEHPVQRVGVQPREQFAQGRLVRRHPQPDPGQVLIGQVGGPLPDGGERAGPGQHRGHRDREHPCQGVADPTRVAR